MLPSFGSLQVPAMPESGPGLSQELNLGLSSNNLSHSYCFPRCTLAYASELLGMDTVGNSQAPLLQGLIANREQLRCLMRPCLVEPYQGSQHLAQGAFTPQIKGLQEGSIPYLALKELVLSMKYARGRMSNADVPPCPMTSLCLGDGQEKQSFPEYALLKPSFLLSKGGKGSPGFQV